MPDNAALAVKGFPSLAEVFASPDDFLRKLDIAALNLICATDLPGSESLSIPDLLAWFDNAAETIRIDKEDGYDRFLEAPAAFENSQAKFCIVQMVTVLQRKLGVRYNPKWVCITPEAPIPEEFGADANDIFIHAIINGIGGTCASLPFFYVAVGRRLGYPLKLVKARRHLFVRWDDSGGKQWFHAERFNIEATGPGVHFLSDEHYKTWPHEIPVEDLDAGTYLKSLTPAEEFAECLATRGYCLVDNGRIGEAIEAFGLAVRLSPNNRYFKRIHERLLAFVGMTQRGEVFVEATPPPQRDWPREPTWIAGSDGREMLVQVLKPGHYPSQPTEMRMPLVPHMVQLPNGQVAHAHVPLSGPHNQMQAEWLQLPGGEYALIHRQRSTQWQAFSQAGRTEQSGQPILPSNAPIAHHGIVNYERQELISRIEPLRAPPNVPKNRLISRQLGLALPSPIRPRLPSG